jgi:hypothetical protein
LGICFVVWLVLFLLCREIVCWYFKLTDILAELRAMTAELRAARASQAVPVALPVVEARRVT